MMEINVVSVILSALYPGLGQLRNVEITKGLFLILFFTMVLIMAFYPATPIQLVGYILIPLVWVWNVVDASQLFMYRPGVAVATSKIQRTLIYVVISWFVIEIVFVAFMWFVVHEEPVEAPPKQPGSEWLLLPETSSGEESPSLTPPPTEDISRTRTSQITPTQPSEPSVAPAGDVQTPPTSQSETTEPVRPASTEPTPPSVYAVSLGIFAGPILAGEQRDAAVQAGYPVEVNQIQVGGHLRYIVLVPGFDVLSDANRASDALKKIPRFRDATVVRYSKLKLIE